MEQDKIYYAKSADEHHGMITNKEHLQRVGALAKEYGAEIGMADAAGLAGDLHDFGKYSERFQNVLKNIDVRIDHAFPGAAMLYEKLGAEDEGWKNNASAVPIIEAVAGHHDGLYSINQIEDELDDVLTDDMSSCCPSGKTPSLRGEDEFQRAEQAFERDFPGYSFARLKPKRYNSAKQTENMLDTRMLFSCLVDADYSVSASDDDPDYLIKNSGGELHAAAMLQNLEQHCTELRQNSTADPAVNAIRNEVYDRCGAAGEQEMGLFTLTAPTGVGKTMAMLNFALRHCQKHHLRRIIVVLPFLTLAEQTEKEYRNIFPEILIDHSQRDLTDDARDLAARWDSPVIITTSVRFFESLFSNNPRDCRKLHNICGSVVLFDEAQSLPASLASQTIRAVNALCREYRCTMVFSTATQPDFSALPRTEWTPTEILPDNSELFDKMRRVDAKWCHDVPLSEIAAEMSAESNACCIVNMRRHARALFELLREQCGSDDGLFFLTTDLCPAHRMKTVEMIKQRQKLGERCLVVATQCIEAGVDLDFDAMFRALAPLEGIVQAAGRCNRNGRLPHNGRLTVFRPLEEGRLYPGDSYERAANVVSLLWADIDAPDLNDTEQIKKYYEKYFGAEKENLPLKNAILKKDYAETAKEYRLIKTAGVALIVPWEGEAKLFEKASAAAREGHVTKGLIRAAAPITVNCFDEKAVMKCATPLKLRRGKMEIETGTYILNTGYESCYDSVTGLELNGQDDCILC